MLTRADLEAREDATLAPYAFRSRDSRGRSHPEGEHVYRGVFQRDRDRIIHSTAFRRLEYKTQVFVNDEGDYYRTRLTHTMEVAQIARSVARALRLNEDLTEAVALAHDLGHTPFGHSGEEALDELMADHGGFEHNRQSLRIVDLLEKRYPGFPGLNLSHEVRDAIASSPGGGTAPTKGARRAGALLETQVVDLADSLAYDHHDLDDGLRAGLITLDQLREVELWSRAAERVRSQHGELPDDLAIPQTIISLINEQVTALVEHTLINLQEAGIDSVAAVREYPGRLVGYPPELADLRDKLEAFLRENVYRHYRVVRMAAKARRFIVELFRAYEGNPDMLPPVYREWVQKQGRHTGICDYIAGMTDRYAQEEYVRLFHPFQRV